MHGEGGDSAVGAIDGSAAGGLWDNTLLSTGVTGASPKAAAAQGGILTYTLSTLAEGFQQQLHTHLRNLMLRHRLRLLFLTQVLKV